MGLKCVDERRAEAAAQAAATAVDLRWCEWPPWASVRVECEVTQSPVRYQSRFLAEETAQVSGALSVCQPVSAMATVGAD